MTLADLFKLSPTFQHYKAILKARAAKASKPIITRPGNASNSTIRTIKPIKPKGTIKPQKPKGTIKPRKPKGTIKNK